MFWLPLSEDYNLTLDRKGYPEMNWDLIQGDASPSALCLLCQGKDPET